MMETEKPRRVRKIERMRAEVQRAAIDLIRAKGFDNVSIGEIAEAADIDPSTFWRHFKTKEGVLFTDQKNWLSNFRLAFDAEPDDKNVLDAVISALQMASKGVDPEFDELRSEVFVSDPSRAIKAAILTSEDEARQAVADAIACRLGVDPTKDARPHVLATMIVSTAQWLRQNQTFMSARNSDPRNLQLINRLIHEVAELIS